MPSPTTQNTTVPNPIPPATPTTLMIGMTPC